MIRQFTYQGSRGMMDLHDLILLGEVLSIPRKCLCQPTYIIFEFAPMLSLPCIGLKYSQLRDHDIQLITWQIAYVFCVLLSQDNCSPWKTQMHWGCRMIDERRPSMYQRVSRSALTSLWPYDCISCSNWRFFDSMNSNKVCPYYAHQLVQGAASTS